MIDATVRKVRLWRSLQVFNGYRLVQMPLMAVMGFFSIDTVTRHAFDVQSMVIIIGCLHTTLVLIGCLLSWRWQKRLHLQLDLQVLTDALCVSSLMFCTDGIRSGFVVVLLITVAGASLMTQRRLALFYAAIAAIALLVMTLAYGLTHSGIDAAEMAYAGFLSLASFAVAYGAHLVGRRLSLNEDLAWQRGVALDDQVRISRRVMERMNDGVLVVDSAGVIIDRNPMALAILGKNPDREKGQLSLIDPELSACYQTWRQGGEAEAEIRRFDGTDIAVNFAYTYSSGGTSLVFLRDLSKIRQQAQQFKLASLGRLTASIAHEIRNPLSSIRHAGELLAEDAQDPASKRLLQIVSDNVLRLDRIIQDVLALGRQRSDGQEKIALAAFLGEFIPELEGQENVPPGVIVFETPENATLGFDVGQFRQVLWNLLGNALRYASRRPGAIRLVVKALADGVELHISDDGPGIPNELQHQIFEPFFTTSAKGTGLGLHIARELCEANGAVLFLEPGANGGHFVLKGKELPCPSPLA